MKKIAVILTAALMAGGIIAGGIAASAKPAQRDYIDNRGHEQYATVEEAKEAIYHEINVATENYANQFNGEPIDGIEKDDEWYGMKLGFKAGCYARADFADEVLEIMKIYGGISQERTSAEFEADRGLWYDYLIDMCNVYSDESLCLSNRDKAMLEINLRFAYTPLESEEWMPANEGKFETVRAKRDAAMTAIEGVGIEPTMNRKIALGLA